MTAQPAFLPYAPIRDELLALLLAARIARCDILAAARDLRCAALRPALGLAGWDDANVDAAYYDDARVYRVHAVRSHGTTRGVS